MKASMKSVMKNSMNKIMKESDLEYKNFLPKILCGAKNIGVCGSKKKTKNDRFVVTATIHTSCHAISYLITSCNILPYDIHSSHIMLNIILHFI
jgi:hypothetical protein